MILDRPNGLELARLFRQRYPKKPAILVSGYVAMEQEDLLQDDPFVRRLKKLVSRLGLEAVIVELLALQGQER